MVITKVDFRPVVMECKMQCKPCSNLLLNLRLRFALTSHQRVGWLQAKSRLWPVLVVSIRTTRQSTWYYCLTRHIYVLQRYIRWVIYNLTDCLSLTRACVERLLLYTFIHVKLCGRDERYFATSHPFVHLQNITGYWVILQIPSIRGRTGTRLPVSKIISSCAKACSESWTNATMFMDIHMSFNSLNWCKLLVAPSRRSLWYRDFTSTHTSSRYASHLCPSYPCHPGESILRDTPRVTGRCLTVISRPSAGCTSYIYHRYTTGNSIKSGFRLPRTGSSRDGAIRWCTCQTIQGIWMLPKMSRFG